MRASVIAALVAATVAVVAAYGQPRPEKLPRTPIDPQRLSRATRVLASDEFLGRGPATPGETRTVDFLIKRFKALGLKPGGEKGSWTQAVPLHRYTVEGPVAMSLKANGWSQPLVQGDDAVAVTMRPVDRVKIENAPLVFVGYGVSAPERDWDDFKGVDLKGKIAVVLVNDPDFEADLGGRFGGKAMTYYGRWTYKYEEAARRGALGVLIVHETPGAGYGWTTVKNSNTGPQFDIVRPDPAKDKVLLQGWLQRDRAVELFSHAGLHFDALKAAAQKPDFQPVPLTGASFSADYKVDTRKVVTHNVLARLPGVDRAGETVMYSAHWDHFGVMPGADPKKPRSDQIFHGAADDGTGVAALLELARAYVHAPPTRRSVVFAAWTAEERGLLGSEYYATHPVYPLATTVADFNIDVLQTAGPSRDLVLVGSGKDTLEDLLAAAAAQQGRRVTPDSHPEVGSFYRGDQFSLARHGVPVLSLMALGGGPDLLAGGRAAGDAWVKEYTTQRYHTPEDRWSAAWDLRGAALDVALVYEVGRELANSGDWPQWKAGSEFAAAREASRAAHDAAVAAAAKAAPAHVAGKGRRAGR